eukprot:5071022-Prymnesium_polylepis.1
MLTRPNSTSAAASHQHGSLARVERERGTMRNAHMLYSRSRKGTQPHRIPNSPSAAASHQHSSLESSA